MDCPHACSCCHEIGKYLWLPLVTKRQVLLMLMGLLPVSTQKELLDLNEKLRKIKTESPFSWTLHSTEF